MIRAGVIAGWSLFAGMCLVGGLSGACGGLRRGGAPDAGGGAAGADGASSGPTEHAGAGDGGAVADASSSSAPASEPELPRAGGHCGAGEVAILLAPGEEGCVIECKSTAGCPAGWACDEDGVRSNEGKPGAPVRFCRLAAHAPGAHDGGAGPHAGPGEPGGAGARDAGKGSAPVDAGKVAPAPAPTPAPPRRPRRSGST